MDDKSKSKQSRSKIGRNNSKIADLVLNRDEINENILTQKYSFKTADSTNPFAGGKRYLKKYYKPSVPCMKNYLLERFPFFAWIPQYDYKENLLKDVIAGLTIGIIQIPQGKFFLFLFK
jgi:hypothetical protein